MSRTTMIGEPPFFVIIILFGSLRADCQTQAGNSRDIMMFGDTTRPGVTFSKDPHVVRFKGHFLMYYSVPAYKDITGIAHDWGITVAKRPYLISWENGAPYLKTKGE